jgi:NTE family protein
VSDDPKCADLVFEGGGVKGIGLAGAYSVLAEHGYAPQQVAGTSAGAITAAFVAAGATGEHLHHVVTTMQYRSFEDRRPLERIPGLGEAANLFTHLGLYRGDAFLEWMRGQLRELGVTRFADLRHPLKVVASDVTAKCMLVLPDDAPKIGLDPEQMEVAEAVRMSMSIPLFFEPVRRASADGEHLIVDGGLLSNFPIWLFDCQDRVPKWPTFGLLLVEPDPHSAATDHLHDDHGGSSLPEYLKSLVQTMLEAHDRLYVQKADYARTIPIPTLGVGTTEFGITPERIAALYESGRAAATEFLAHWDFQAYVQAFRQGHAASRREDVRREMAAAPGPA